MEHGGTLVVRSQPQSGVRMQPTAHAVGKLATEKPQRGERSVLTQALQPQGDPAFSVLEY